MRPQEFRGSNVCSMMPGTPSVLSQLSVQHQTQSWEHEDTQEAHLECEEFVIHAISTCCSHVYNCQIATVGPGKCSLPAWWIASVESPLSPNLVPFSFCLSLHSTSFLPSHPPTDIPFLPSDHRLQDLLQTSIFLPGYILFPSYIALPVRHQPGEPPAPLCLSSLQEVKSSRLILR